MHSERSNGAVDEVSSTPSTPSVQPSTPPYTLHRSFFWIESSFFLLFLAFMTVQNLASSLIGDTATLALALLYVAYIISNLLAPVQMKLFCGNPNLAMFFGSFSYTLFVFVCYLALCGYEWILFPAAILMGSCGGLIWVGNGVYLTALSKHSADSYVDKVQALHVAVQHNPFMQEQDASSAYGPMSPSLNSIPNVQSTTATYLYEQYLQVKNAAISLMNSVQWVVMNLNLVIGCLIAFALVQDGTTNVKTGDVDVDVDQSKILFLTLTGVGLLANICFLVTYKTAISCQVEVVAASAMEQVTDTVRRAWRVAGASAVVGAIPYFFTANMLMNYFYSGFATVVTKRTLGPVYVPLICAVAAFCEILGAMLAKPWCQTLGSTRWTGCVGTILLLAYQVIVAVFPHENWSDGRETTIQWVAVLGLAVLAGTADGLAATAVNTLVSQLAGENNELRAPLFSVMQVMKGLGSVVAFVVVSTADYDVGNYIMIVFTAISMLSQLITALFKPEMDVSVLQGMQISVLKEVPLEEITHENTQTKQGENGWPKPTGSAYDNDYASPYTNQEEQKHGKHITPFS